MNTSVTSPIDSRQSALWSFERGRSPLVGTAIHDGHHVWPDLMEAMALDEAGRLREEDPFTAEMIADIANRVVVHRSRFEVDLNRPSEGAVYLTPEQAWGLQVWRSAPEGERLQALLAQHAAYYAMLKAFLESIVAEHHRFVLLDMHSYNHRRDGADAAPTDPDKAPVINIGTFSMDRARWAHVLDPFMDALREQTVMGHKLDVRENIAFEGRGEQTRFVHEHFPETGCAIAVEFKKVFMDEWTGEPDRMVIAELRAAIAASLPVLVEALGARP
ncbi:N-formylglutamate amidohydrolase [Devosia sediminis]|uniref:N-formylglutamate amidohydrolase n=1 Tax=Devosia sediminis TaxID=2798801 RepID=A0A934J241_9HYPH|nr:N-formylglutamate amidohydrolase [Devosia sediminis]MBJ3786838.1 N-formylglutamate amidohydrolase [Devosia sediminis]